MTDEKTALRTAELFRACPEGYLDRIMEASEVVQYETAQVLFEPGAESDSVHVVLSGMVALYVLYHNGTMLTFDILGPGGVTGTSGFFHRDFHPIRAMAIMPSKLLVLPARFLQGSLLLKPKTNGRWAYLRRALSPIAPEDWQPDQSCYDRGGYFSCRAALPGPP